MALAKAHPSRIVIPLLAILVLPACGSTETAMPQPAATVPQSAPSASEATEAGGSFPLSEPGPYNVGIRRGVAFEDASRGNREVSIAIWYPAIMPQDSTLAGPVSDAVADPSGAPYPLLLSSSKAGFAFGPHLASYGFVVAGVYLTTSADTWAEWLIDYPLDILFALDQIATQPLDGLEGVIDTDHAGAMGYSFDGYDALAMSGARVDPEFYLGQCANAATMQPAPPAWWIEYICSVADEWDQFAAHAGEALTTSDDGLWQPMTDERIRAVMPMAPEGSWLFGERGLAAVDRPTLIIDGTADDINIYSLEAAYTFQHLGDRASVMISFVGQDHMMIFDTAMVARMAHFATAFFGYYLQGRADYGQYFSQEFVEEHDDLAWGVYEGG
jgi:predicted dienelactone hydrolase